MNSVYYYHTTFWRHLKRIAASDTRLNSEIANRILNFDSTSKTKDPAYWLGRLLGSISSVDRTGMFNNFKCDYEPIPEIGNFNKSFGQICLETAEQYWKDNNYLEVLWSGGIDSTSASLALLETKPDDKTLVIVCTQSSIDEYPLFYDRYKEYCRVLTSEEFFSIENINSTNTVITGDGGDQIFGANLAVLVDDADFHKKDLTWHGLFDWPDVFKQQQLKAGSKLITPWTNREKTQFIELLEQHITACPFPIKSCFDMSWWLNFSTKMNYVQIRIPVIILEKFGKEQSKFNLNTRKAFYLNDDFQRWSMVNHDLKISSESKSYKQPSKDFIFSINGDADYALNKQKEPSTPKLLGDRWFSNWKSDLTSNYVILGDGRIFNSTRDISTELIEEIFKKESNVKGS